jgi:hypothetical protein
MKRKNPFAPVHPLPVALFGALLVAFSARADDSVWRELHSRSAGLRAEVPAEPQLEYEEEMTLVGKVAHHHYIVEHPDARFDLERLDLPAVAVLFLSSRRLLERSKDGYVEELDVLVDGVEEIEIQGHPGLRLLFRHRAAGSVQAETRFILAGRYLYMVGAGPRFPEVRATMVERVFSSFRICLEGEPPCDAAARVDSD